MGSEALQQFRVNEDGAAVFLARIYGDDGTFAQAQFGTITRYIKDRRTKQVVASDELVTSAVVYDALQTNAITWPYSTGYNFRDVIPASKFSEPRDYELQYKFTPTGAEVFWSEPVVVNVLKNAAS